MVKALNDMGVDDTSKELNKALKEEIVKKGTEVKFLDFAVPLI